MGEERRQFSRLDARLTTIFKICRTGKVHRALTKNISGAGLRLVVEETLQTGDELGLEIQLPDRSTPISCSGTVTWTQPSPEPRKSYQPPLLEIGVAFREIPPKDQATITQYAALNALPPLSDTPRA